VAKIWFLGEALIDFVPASSDGETAYIPRCGGSPYNAAIATARQGADVGFLGAISTDIFGGRLADRLSAEGIDISRAERPGNPTTLAFVDLDGAEPRYAFFNRMSATQLMAPDPLGFSPSTGDVLHVGSISLIDTPGAENIRRFAEAMAGRMPVSVDPNARPGMTHDPEDWRRRLGGILSRASIVKLSSEDLTFVAPGAEAETFARSLIDSGTGLVVLTEGERGARAFTPSVSISVPARMGPMVDTVGAGDTVTGTILAALARRGLETRDSVAVLDEGDLRSVLERAMLAAFLNCERSGCDPPTKAEIDAAADRGFL